MERKNFENLVHHNSSKLRLIQRGWNAFKVFTQSERNNLKKEGILLSGSSINSHLMISKEAINILNTIQKG